MMFGYRRMFRLASYDLWMHHRHGWRSCIKELEKYLCVPDRGVLLFPNRTITILQGTNVVTENWVGMIHATPNCLRGIALNNAGWHKSLKYCKGIYVFSQWAADTLQQLVPVPVCALIHPTVFDVPTFSWEMYEASRQKSLFFIGHWLRRYDVFEHLKTDLRKVMLKCESNSAIDLDGVEKMNYLPQHEYDACLRSNVVFLDVVDASANNIVLECIARNTPLLCRRHPAIVEYLGAQYPFYFSDLDEAESKINNTELIEAAHCYIRHFLGKSKYAIRNFLYSVIWSDVYRSLRLC